MRRVLVLAYHFPPLGGAGVQRSAKFVQYLPQFGYESTVVTTALGVSDWTPPDDTMLATVPTGTVVDRVDGPEPLRSAGWRGRGERWLRLRSDFSTWWIEGAIATGRRAGRDVDVIYASMSPFESGEAAARLALDLKRPWVADLRDPWALDEVLVYPTAAHRRLELQRMRRTLSSASAVVMNTPEATHQLLVHFPELRTKPVLTIPNGFDPADFSGPPPERNDSVFRIVHAGHLHTPDPGEERRGLAARALGGSVAGFDLFTRSHLYLLQAVERAIAGDPDLRNILRIDLAGALSEQARQTIESEVVHVHGYLPHAETIDLLRAADLLFLPMHDLPAGRRARIVPGKTYEYLASGSPILGALPEGDARDLLARAGTALLCRPSAVDCMARVILEQVERFRAGSPPPVLAPGVLRPYERRNLTAQLAEAFDLVVGAGQSSQPVTAESIA